MPIQTISYLDIPVEVRHQAAAQEALRLRNLLTNPVMTVEQRSHITQQLERLNGWLAGTLLNPNNAPLAVPEEHEPPMIMGEPSVEEVVTPPLRVESVPLEPRPLESTEPLSTELPPREPPSEPSVEPPRKRRKKKT